VSTGCVRADRVPSVVDDRLFAGQVAASDLRLVPLEVQFQRPQEA
jgi:hypothetical protein